MNLSKTFDCIPHNVLIAKSKAFGFGIENRKVNCKLLLQCEKKSRYRYDIKQLVENKDHCTSGLFARSFILQFFLNNFIYTIEKSEVCNFADDNTIFSCGNSFEAVASSIKVNMSKSMSWPKTNQMVVNTSKLQVLLFDLNLNENIVLEVRRCSIDVANSIVTLLVVTIGPKLNFNQYVSKIFQTTNSKIDAFPDFQIISMRNNHLSSTTHL